MRRGGVTVSSVAEKSERRTVNFQRPTSNIEGREDERRKPTAADQAGDRHYDGELHAEYTRSDGRYGKVRSFNRERQSVWSLVGAFLKLWGHTKHSPSLMSTEKAPVLSAEVTK